MAGKARSGTGNDAVRTEDARSGPSSAETASAADAGTGNETLFAYQVLEADGDLVIRVGGSLVADAIGELRQQMAAQKLGLGALLSPLSSIGRLMSPAVPVAPAQQPWQAASPTVPAARPDWLNQELAQSFTEFQDQVEQFRVALEEIRKERDDGAAEPDAGADTAGR